MIFAASQSDLSVFVQSQIVSIITGHRNGDGMAGSNDTDCDQQVTDCALRVAHPRVPESKE